MAEAVNQGTTTPNQTQADTANPQQPVDAGTQAGSEPGNSAKAAAQEAMRKFKVKVDNQEIEVDEAELLKGYTHGKAAAKRFQEGQRAKAQAEQFIKLMREGTQDPAKLQDVLYKLGYTRQQIRAISEKFLAAEIQEDLMDPKDKELKTYKEKVAAYEAEKKRQQEDLQKREHEKLKKKYAEEFTGQFVEALKTTGLPQTKPMVAEMAKYIKRAADIGYQLSPLDAAKLVKEDEEARFQGVVGESEAEILAKMLGEKNLQKLREWEAKRLKNPAANLETPQEQPDVRRQRDNVQRMTPQQWRAFNRAK